MGIEQLVILIIVIAAVLAIVGLFVPIDQRIRSALWIFVGAVVCIVLIGFLFGLVGTGTGPFILRR